MGSYMRRAGVDGKRLRMRARGRFYVWLAGRPTCRNFRSRFDQELKKTIFRHGGRLKLTRRERLIGCGIFILVLLAGLAGGWLGMHFHD